MEQLLASGSVWDWLGGAAEPAGAVMVWKVLASLCCAAGQCTGELDMGPDPGHSTRAAQRGGSALPTDMGMDNAQGWGLPQG